MNRQPQISKGIDWSLVWIYILLVGIGFVSIYMVQYRDTQNVMNVLLKGTEDYGKQVRWIVICIFLAIFILLTDSKFFTATANLQYGFGLLLLLLVFPLHASIKGTNSIIRFGSFQLQPAELCKVFTLLALAKFLSRQETDFRKPRAHLIAAAITLLPALITIAQKETGLALVYASLFLAMYREGLPLTYITLVIAFAVLVITALLVPPLYLLYATLGIGALCIFVLRRQMKRNKALFFRIVLVVACCIGFQRLVMPMIWKNLPHHQTDRIASTFGIDQPAFVNTDLPADTTKNTAKPAAKKEKQSEYNVKQSKIAIGSGGLLGKGFLNNTQTRFDFVPEQHTDFIFCSIAEAFGFAGSMVLFLLYVILLWRITVVAERQRSTFSRVYAYGVASIIFFHIFINLAMTMGLAPVIGIPLPFVSYGGTSLITFTVLLFILIKLDADRQMILR